MALDNGNNGFLLNSLANVAEASIYRGIMPTIFARGLIPSFYEPAAKIYQSIRHRAAEQTPFAPYADVENQSSEEPGFVWDIRVLAFKDGPTMKHLTPRQRRFSIGCLIHRTITG